MSNGTYQHVRVSGGPHERGVQLGQQAGRQIKLAIEMYKAAFDHYTGLGWRDVRRRASAYQPAIEAYDAEIVPEMAGIAEGAGLDLEDILAINTRTEIMYGHGAQQLAIAECTALGARGSATAGGRVLMAQNWDWLPAAAQSCIVLEVEIPERTSFITFVEAGLMGKMGMNAAGVGMVTNLLLTEEDCGEPGVPFHVLLRGILTSTSFDDAVEAVTRADRASSGNYLIADVDGRMVDLEARPGGVHAIEPVNDSVHHANTFCGPIGPHTDRGLEALPDSPGRTDRMGRMLEERRGRLDIDVVSQMLRDHEAQPSSVCRHAPEGAHPIEGIVTVGSVILDLQASRLHLAFGQPCERAHEEIVPAFAAREQMV